MVLNVIVLKRKKPRLHIGYQLELGATLKVLTWDHGSGSGLPRSLRHDKSHSISIKQ